MDFEAYETFLENLSSVRHGVNYLIQKVNDNPGKRFVWSPVAPDIVEEGALDYIGREFVYTDIETIPQVILECLNDEDFIVELVYMNTYNVNHYCLSIGH